MSEVFNAQNNTPESEPSKSEVLRDATANLVQQLTGGTVSQNGYEILISFPEKHINIAK